MILIDLLLSSMLWMRLDDANEVVLGVNEGEGYDERESCRRGKFHTLYYLLSEVQ